MVYHNDYKILLMYAYKMFDVDGPTILLCQWKIKVYSCDFFVLY